MGEVPLSCTKPRMWSSQGAEYGIVDEGVWGAGVGKSTFDLVEDVVVRIKLVEVDRIHDLKISRISVSRRAFLLSGVRHALQCVMPLTPRHFFFCFFFFTLVTGPRRSLNLKLSDTRVYEP